MAILVHYPAQNYIKKNSDRPKEFTFRMSAKDLGEPGLGQLWWALTARGIRRQGVFFLLEKGVFFQREGLISGNWFLKISDI